MVLTAVLFLFSMVATDDAVMRDGAGPTDRSAGPALVVVRTY